MRCAEVRSLVSAAADGEVTAVEREELGAELARCSDCWLFAARLAQVRSQLRFEIVGAVPDLVAPVLERIVAPVSEADTVVRPTGTTPRGTRAGRRHGSRGVFRRPRIPVAAALVAGFVAGVVFVGLAREPQSPTAAFDVSAAVLGAQTQVTLLAADLTIVERGWTASVPLRTYEGTIRYASPESLALQLHDVTRYPSRRWVANDVTSVVDADRAWSRASRACPREALPGCQVAEPVVQVVERREPFPDAAALPLDLVVPVRSFLLAAAAAPTTTGLIAGRQAVRVEATVAQTRPLLDGILAVGAWRELAPSDRVDLWLDADAMVPLRVSVFPSTSPDRLEWAARHGYADRAGTAVLEIRLDDVRLNEPVTATSGTAATGTLPLPPEGSTVRSAGFVTDPAVAASLTPTRLPAGMQLVRTGRVVVPGAAPVGVAAWSDGRAWLKVRATRGWTSPRLFGDLGDVVRAHRTSTAGVAYADERGSKIALHADEIDLVVTGSLSEASLRDVAASLGVVGRSVPANWPEAASRSIAELRERVPGLLLPEGLVGFGPPAARLRGAAAVLAYAGPGERGFELVVTPAATLGPPLDSDAREVTLRGGRARWSPALGRLEWEEGEAAVSLSSETLSLDDLVAVAATLVPV